MAPLIAQIISYINLAIKAAPAVKEVYEEGRNLIGQLANGGLISSQQQNELMKWADAHQAATLAGEIPPELTVE